MPENRAQYSCDACRSRKVACSRDRSGCQRCKADSIACSYSRSGVIRRNRRPKRQLSPVVVEARSAQPTPQGSSEDPDASAHARLHRLVGKDHPSLGVLASLLEEHAAAWQDTSAFDAWADGAQRDFFGFEDSQVRAWFDVFIATLQKEKLLLPSPQSDVLECLLASRPHQLQDRAWLVMFYTITLSTNVLDASTKMKIRSNLWLAFNDVRLLLEPRMSRIQALVTLVCYGEEFMTPSVCWMLISKACMMLQAVGITHGRFDSEMRERRNMLFWRLNTLDKALALILCKSPTISREMAAGIPIPSLDQLLTSVPSYSSTRVPVLFDAHYMSQMHLLSNVMADVWHCLYGQDSYKVLEVKESLEKWYRQAIEVLEAAALAEKPLLSANIAILVDFGLKTIHYHYYSLLVLIMVSSRQLRAQSTYPSLQLLRLLPPLSHMAASLRQPYCCLLWQQLHCPLTAFGTLWGEIAIKGELDSQQIQQFVEAIDCLPPYLLKLGSRNPLATKLAQIVKRIIQNTHSIPWSRVEADTQKSTTHSPTSLIPDQPSRDMNDLNEQPNTLRLPLEPRAAIEASDTAGTDGLDFQIDSLFTWPDDGFLNATVDWFTWSNEELS